MVTGRAQSQYSHECLSINPRNWLIEVRRVLTRFLQDLLNDLHERFLSISRPPQTTGARALLRDEISAHLFSRAQDQGSLKIITENPPSRSGKCNLTDSSFIVRLYDQTIDLSCGYFPVYGVFCCLFQTISTKAENVVGDVSLYPFISAFPGPSPPRG